MLDLVHVGVAVDARLHLSCRSRHVLRVHSCSPVLRVRRDLRVCESQERLQTGIHEELIGLEVPVPDAYGAGRGCHGEPLLTVAQRILRCLALGDIDGGAEEATVRAVRSILRNAQVQDPPVRAVGRADAVFHAERPVCFDGRNIGACAALDVVRVDSVQPAVVEQLVERKAREFHTGAVEIVERRVGPDGPHHDGSEIGDQTKLLFTLAQSPLDARASRSLDQ